MEFSSAQRKNLAEKKEAMFDGSYPIRNVSDLKRAIQAYGRAKDKEAAKRWIKKRAKELDATNLLPESWTEDAEHSSMQDEYLIHHGVKGMKWGVRRYQNKDGSLTSAGKAREKKKTSGWSKDAKVARKLKRKSVNQLSNKELQTLNTRMNLENNYRSLNPSKVKKGLTYVGAATAAMGTVLAFNNTSGRFVSLGKDFYKKLAR